MDAPRPSAPHLRGRARWDSAARAPGRAYGYVHARAYPYCPLHAAKHTIPCRSMKQSCSTDKKIASHNMNSADIYIALSESAEWAPRPDESAAMNDRASPAVSRVRECRHRGTVVLLENYVAGRLQRLALARDESRRRPRRAAARRGHRHAIEPSRGDHHVLHLVRSHATYLWVRGMGYV